MKLCKDCKHLADNQPSFRFAAEICVRASRPAFKTSLVDGKDFIDYDLAMWAAKAREGGSLCGPEAKWFEQYVPPPSITSKIIGWFKQ